MIIYKDTFTGDELFSDSFPVKLLDEVVFQVKGKLRTDTVTISDSLFGGNASAEGGGEEGADPSSVSGVDFVLNHKLVEFPMDKAGYKQHIKDYMKRVLDKLKKDASPDVELFQKNVASFVKEVIGKFDDYQFYCGESMQPDGMLALLKWDGETPYLYAFKHGLIIEKV